MATSLNTETLKLNARFAAFLSVLHKYSTNLVLSNTSKYVIFGLLYPKDYPFMKPRGNSPNDSLLLRCDSVVLCSSTDASNKAERKWRCR
ncbi:hypothetical protein AcW1_008807 [Taiwanofungus camphoratus]|nr:hypothetical protein AcV5_006836 [Antrodia cinnamomea]KAI0935212.1 hypothetical protein AcV7_003709 [Antrodia cinnamomea]KAI0949107.1 hypothetical protein AcW1_008807 [Antrodia cinnamomea]